MYQNNNSGAYPFFILLKEKAISHESFGKNWGPPTLYIKYEH